MAFSVSSLSLQSHLACACACVRALFCVCSVSLWSLSVSASGVQFEDEGRLLPVAMAALVVKHASLKPGSSANARSVRDEVLLPVPGTFFAVQPRRVVRQDLSVPVLEVRGVAPVVHCARLISL